MIALSLWELLGTNGLEGLRVPCVQRSTHYIPVLYFYVIYGFGAYLQAYRGFLCALHACLAFSFILLSSISVRSPAVFAGCLTGWAGAILYVAQDMDYLCH